MEREREREAYTLRKGGHVGIVLGPVYVILDYEPAIHSGGADNIEKK